ncbi:MAG: hypothetical protein ACRC62_29565 [Microcoleus sp.]
MQEWRTVNFAVRNSSELQAWANGRIVIRRSPASFTNTHLAPEDTVIVPLDANGVGSRRLWCNDEGQIPSSYHMTLPDKKTCFCFVLPRSAPDPVGIWTLIAAGITEQMPNYQTLLDYINSQGGGAGGSAASVAFVPGTTGLGTNVQTAITALATQNAFLENNFQQSSLSVAGILPIVHNLGKRTSKVFIWDSTDSPISPDDIDPVSTSATAVDLSTYQPLPGVWRYRIEV